MLIGIKKKKNNLISKSLILKGFVADIRLFIALLMDKQRKQTVSVFGFEDSQPFYRLSFFYLS